MSTATPDTIPTLDRADFATPAEIARNHARLRAAAPDLLAALQQAQSLIRTARNYFPKSIRNHDRFALETTCATIGSAIARASGS